MLYFFYQSIAICTVSIPATYIFLCIYGNTLCIRRQNELQKQFKDMIQAVLANLQAGNSMENAFIKAGREVELIYGKESDIYFEMNKMELQLKNNLTLEQILMDLGNRSGVSDIKSFAEVFSTAKRGGGNFREMIENICEIISAKVDTEIEITTLIAGKVMEQRIMSIVPFIIILYISFSSPGYFDSLYHNTFGIITMSILLGIYLLSVYIAQRIIDIKV